MSVEAVALDLDGVIIYDNQLAPGAVDSIHAVQDKGLPIFPVTSRDFLRCLWRIDEIGFKDPGVFSGGAAIADFVPEKKVVWERRIAQATAHALVKELLPHSETINVGKGQRVINKKDPLQDVDEDCFGVWAEIPEVHLEEASLILRRFDELHHLEHHYNHGTVGRGIAGVHITAARANKFHTTRAVLQKLGIAPENTLAVADGDNDLPLFQAVGIGVAMGNASEALKAAADHQVGDILAGGFAEAIEKFVLGREITHERS